MNVLCQDVEKIIDTWVGEEDDFTYCFQKVEHGTSMVHLHEEMARILEYLSSLGILLNTRQDKDCWVYISL